MANKTILCFGDSNTWGWDPSTKERFPKEIRWTGILKKELGEDYDIIEEGLNGRTTVWDDPIEGYKNGSKHIIPCLETHRPFDLIVLMLGTNDLKNRFSVSAYDIANSIAVLLDIISKSNAGTDGGKPRILLMCPPPVGKLSEFADAFIGSEKKSRDFGKYYKAVAQQFGCDYLDTSDYIVSSDIDGIHFEASEHRKLGLAVAGKIKSMCL